MIDRQTDSLHKETNQQLSGEEKAAYHSPLYCWSRVSLRDFPALLEKSRRLKCRIPKRDLGRDVFQLFSALLGYVIWPLKDAPANIYFLLPTAECLLNLFVFTL